MNKQWDYTGKLRIGDNPTLAENPMYAIYVNPEGITKKILLEEYE